MLALRRRRRRRSPASAATSPSRARRRGRRKGTARLEAVLVPHRQGPLRQDLRRGARHEPAGLAVLPLLKAALAAEANWRAEPPPGRHRLVSLRSLDAAAARSCAHPVGVLSVSQKVGAARPDASTASAASRPSGDDQFAHRRRPRRAPAAARRRAGRGSFAPAQFFDATDAEKLSQPVVRAVRQRHPRRRLRAARLGYAAARDVEYELSYIDSRARPRRAPSASGPTWSLFDAHAVAGAVAAFAALVRRATATLGAGARRAVVGPRRFPSSASTTCAPIGASDAASERGRGDRPHERRPRQRPGLRGRAPGRSGRTRRMA